MDLSGVLARLLYLVEGVDQAVPILVILKNSLSMQEKMCYYNGHSSN